MSKTLRAGLWTLAVLSSLLVAILLKVVGLAAVLTGWTVVAWVRRYPAAVRWSLATLAAVGIGLVVLVFVDSSYAVSVFVVR